MLRPSSWVIGSLSRVGIALLAACQSPVRAPEQATVAPPASASPAPSAPASASSAPSPLASASSAPEVPRAARLESAALVATAKSMGSRAALPGRLAHFFAGYADGSNFEFMRVDCQPTLKVFIGLKNVGIDELVRNAKSFFRSKRELAYRPDIGGMRVEASTGGQLVRLPVKMSWTYPIPKDWGPDWPPWGHAVPVVDDPPRRRQRHFAQAVLLRLQGIACLLEHLRPEECRDQEPDDTGRDE